MCILDFMNAKSNSKFSDKLQRYLTQKKYTQSADIIYYNNFSMMEKGKTRDPTMMNNNQVIANFMLDRKREWDFQRDDTKTATFDFSSERSSETEENDETCTLCTSSFSFCNGDK
jgi:hypothetical protein